MIMKEEKHVKIWLTAVSLILITPLIFMMSGVWSGLTLTGYLGGVSTAIWLTLFMMALYVALCGLILRLEWSEQDR